MNQTIRMTTEEFRESPMYSGFQTGQAKRTAAVLLLVAFVAVVLGVVL